MILAWSVTEIIRYTFYLLATCGVSLKPLTYLRYSTFLPLYPIGASSEAFLSLSTLPAFSKLPFWPNVLNISPLTVLRKVPTSWEAKVMKSSLGRSIMWRLAQGSLKASKAVAREWTVVDGVKLVLFVGWWPGESK
jgi:very-long-chain (3R)-3-hydroxyacyl-CoA dehydratase